MSDEHKAALAEGRKQGAAVRAYLDALENNRPKRGRKRTPETMRAQLTRVEEQLASADGIDRLELMQTRRDLEKEIADSERKVDLTELEADFVAHAQAYSDRKGIEYSTWREFGVPVAVLKTAGISR